jgi:hypothetical protein
MQNWPPDQGPYVLGLAPKTKKILCGLCQKTLLLQPLFFPNTFYFPSLGSNFSQIFNLGE